MMVKQKGFGLIELMISLLVSVIIMAGLYGLLTSSIVNFGFSKASSDAVDTAHRVDNFFNVLLFQAGFINFERAINAEGWAAGAVNLPGVRSEDSWEADQFVYAEDNNSILIRYYGSSVDDDTTHHGAIEADESNGFITDCGGVAVGRETLVTAYFTANENGLICQYNDHDRTNNKDTEKDVVLDASVRSLMFEFGSTWDPKFANDDGFFTADEINGNAKLKWSHVDIVRYSFITSQPSNQRLIKSKQDTLRHFNMPDTKFNMPDTKSTASSGAEGEAESTDTAPAKTVDYSYTIPKDDRSNVHRVITGTIYLVNASKTVGEN